MSADNWSICPKCKRLNDEKNKKRIADAEEKYGKVPSTEFIRLIKKVNKPIELKETLREDYEIYINEEDGQFYVGYSCSCSVCGFKHEYKHTENLKF